MSSLVEYHYVDLVGNLVDIKSTFVGVSSLATTLCLGSIAKVEYITVGSGCAQLIWMRNTLKDYGVSGEVLTLYWDNLNAINISKNPI